MNIPADKTPENKSQSITKEASSKRGSGGSASQFVDNRPEATRMGRLREALNNSPRVRQLRAIQEMVDSSLQGKKRLPLKPAQRKPSDMQKEFGSHPLYNLKPLSMIRSLSWNAFVLHTRPYFKIEDDQEQAQKVWLSGWFERLISLVHSPDRDYSDVKLDLAKEVFAAFENERDQLFGGGAGISSDDEYIKLKDPTTQGGAKYTEMQDHAGFSELWARPAKMADVQQGGLGDCYLLAAVASIVNKSPDHFCSHMKDMLNGNVVVKLYEANGTPKNFVIKKSVVGDKYAKGSLWVKLLEKAYAAAGFTGSLAGADRKKTTYAGIAGGSSDVALQHLTGKKTKGFAIGAGRQTVSEKLMKQTKERQEDLKNRIRTIEARIAEKKKLVQDTTEDQLEFNQTMKAFSALLIQIGNLDEKLALKFVTRDHIEEFLKGIEDDPELVALIRGLVALDDEVPLVPGKLGSNIYGKDELLLYERIKAAIDSGQILTAATKKAIHDAENEEEEEKGHSAGESKVKGLASNHAYSVLDYKPKIPDPDEPILILLRNPWGEYSRAYEGDGMGGLQSKAVKGGDGIFWIDIADMVSFFSNLSMTAE